MKSEEIEKMEQEVAYLKAELLKYQELFEADGHVDTEEQQQLDSMQNTIQMVEQKLAEKKSTLPMNSMEPTTSSDDTETNVDDVLAELEGYVSSIKDFVHKWENQLGNNNANIT